MDIIQYICGPAQDDRKLEFLEEIQNKVVDVGCGPKHTPEKGIGRPGRYEPENAARYHSFMVKHGEVYKQTTKG
jgi:hypothetical protein